MANDLVRDPSGVPSDARRIKGHGAVISLAFGVGIGLVSAGALLVRSAVGRLAGRTSRPVLSAVIFSSAPKRRP